MTNSIEIQGLVKGYSSFALGPVDLTVPAGAIVGLIGENGAGKTTLLKCLLGIARPDEGTVRINIPPEASYKRCRTAIHPGS